MIKLNYLVLPLVAIFYFSVSWFFPWDTIQFKSSISVSYVFDILFVAVIFFALKKRVYVGKLDKTKSFLRIVFISLFGFACVIFTKNFGLLSPFKYVDNLFLQILILAPLIEELVFRGAFLDICEKYNISKQVALFSNAFLFCISHSSALWYLGSEFHPFIYFQLFYTLVLGWVCAKARIETKGLLEPILLHLSFNIIFYLAVTSYGL